MPVDRSTYHYRPRRPEQAALSKRIKEIAETRVRYGYRRIHVLLRREGWPVNAKRVCRLYREHGPAIAQQNAEAAGQGQAAIGPHDGRSAQRHLGDGLRARPAVRRHQDPGADHRRHLHPPVAGDRASRQSFRGSDVVETLERGAAEFGYPKTIRVDNGPEFVSKELDLWAFMQGVTLDFSRPGKPTDNAFIESFNGKFRAECLNANWFLSLDEARAKCEAWRRDYNEVRPHSAIGNKCRSSFIGRPAQPGRPAADEAGFS